MAWFKTLIGDVRSAVVAAMVSGAFFLLGPIAAALWKAFQQEPIPWGILGLIAAVGVILLFYAVSKLQSAKASEKAPDGSPDVQTISVKDSGDVTTAAHGASASKISTGSGAINAPVAGRDIIYHAPTESPEKWPYIYPQLIIDSLDIEPGHTLLHFELRNGDVAIENIRIHVSSRHNSFRAYGKDQANAMAPNAELSTIGNCVQRTKDDNDIVRFAVYYTAKVGSITKNLISKHVFHLSKDKLIPGTSLKPSRNEYLEGEAPSYSDPESIHENWLRQLARNRGWIAVAPPEATSTGIPNIMVFNVANKQFFFDGAKRLVTFRIKAPSGNVIDLQQSLETKANGYHMVAFGWRENGGWLRVDDQDEVRKYDE